MNALGEVAELPSNTNAPIDQDEETSGHLSSQHDPHVVGDEDDVTSSDKYCLESIGTSTTIIRRNISGKNITFIVPFKSSSTTRPSTTWMYGPTRIKTSEKFITKLSDRGASLTVRRVGKRDCGKYTCKLRDSTYAIWVVFDLSLNYKPSRPRGPTQGNWRSKDTLVL